MELAEFTDQDFRATILRALRLLAVLTAVALPLIWWKLGWRSGALLVVGAAISGSGLWEWLRLLTAVMRRLEASDPLVPVTDAEEEPSAEARAAARAKVRPVGLVFFGFVVRLVLVLAVLYGSLKLLQGSVIAIALGLGLGIFALTIEGLRLLKAWTV